MVHRTEGKERRKLWCTALRGRREALRQESCEFEATPARSCLRENKLVPVILHPGTQAAGAGEWQQSKPDVKIWTKKQKDSQS